MKGAIGRGRSAFGHSAPSPHQTVWWELKLRYNLVEIESFNPALVSLKRHECQLAGNCWDQCKGIWLNRLSASRRSPYHCCAPPTVSLKPNSVFLPNAM